MQSKFAVFVLLSSLMTISLGCKTSGSKFSEVNSSFRGSYGSTTSSTRVGEALWAAFSQMQAYNIPVKFTPATNGGTYVYEAPEGFTFTCAKQNSDIACTAIKTGMATPTGGTGNWNGYFIHTSDSKSGLNFLIYKMLINRSKQTESISDSGIHSTWVSDDGESTILCSVKGAITSCALGSYDKMNEMLDETQRNVQ